MNKHGIQEKLYLLLGLFFTTTPIFAEPLTATAIAGIAAAGVTVLSSIGGAIGAGAQKRKAQRKERAATARRMAAEANRQDIPDFQQDLANPYANLQVATQANIMQAEQADISLASSLDTLRATGASAGGATALARAAAQSKRGVAASIEQQEAKNAQLRAQGEIQSAQIRQQGQVAAFKAQEERELMQLDRESSLEDSYNQQAAAYGAQSRGMAVQAIGGLASAGLQAYASGMFKGKTPETTNVVDFESQALNDVMDANIIAPEAEIGIDDINVIELEEDFTLPFDSKARFQRHLSREGANALARNRTGGVTGHLNYGNLFAGIPGLG